MELVLAELHRRRESIGDRLGRWDTIYLGGGTPSLLDGRHLATLLEGVSRLGVAPDPEITIEANPDDVTAESTRTWQALGINRVSLGSQSFHPAVLEWMHRTHDAEASRRAVQFLRDAGMQSVSLDLIFGLPDGLEHDFARDIDAALALEPEHLSVYGLTVESQTPLWRWVERGAVRVADDDRYEREFLMAHHTLTAAGFEHYEISNYATSARRARHNGAYWTGRPYLGIGPSAHSLDGRQRRWNVREWAQYERAMEETGDPTLGSEELTEAERDLETALLGLRTADGLPQSWLSRWPDWERAAATGWMLAANGRVRLTPEGWLRIDAMVTRLTTSADGG